MSWLIDHKFLSSYRAFGPRPPDLSAVKVSAATGDYVPGQLAGAMDKAAIYGNIIADYQRYGAGHRFLAFATSCANSEKLAAGFRAAGIAAVHLDGETPADVRRDAIAKFRAGELRGLCNVELFGEGFDVPAASVVILARPTKSIALHKQQVGRVLRFEVGKTALILDHAGNLRPGWLPDDECHWLLEGRKKGAKRPALRSHEEMARCSRCGGWCRKSAVSLCVACGGVRPSPRDCDTIEDVALREYNVRELRRARAAEQANAATLDELVQLGRRRGYRNPQAWADYFFNARKSRQDRLGLGG